MSELSFLKQTGIPATEIWHNVITSSIESTQKNCSLQPYQIEKLQVVLNFIVNQPAEKRAEILNELGCPDSEESAALISMYEVPIKNKGSIHNLKGFDWSTSIILGSSGISNLKEPVTTFRFDVVNKKEETKFVELTIDEAEALLKQIQDARAAQHALLPQ